MTASRRQRQLVRRETTPATSKHQPLIIATIQEWAHQDTASIDSQRRVLQCEANETRVTITRYTAALAVAKEHLANLEAAIDGLTSVVGKR